MFRRKILTLTDKDLPPENRTEANMWKAMYYETLENLRCANAALKRLHARKGIPYKEVIYFRYTGSAGKMEPCKKSDSGAIAFIACHAVEKCSFSLEDLDDYYTKDNRCVGFLSGPCKTCTYNLSHSDSFPCAACIHDRK